MYMKFFFQSDHSFIHAFRYIRLLYEKTSSEKHEIIQTARPSQTFGLESVEFQLFGSQTDCKKISDVRQTIESLGIMGVYLRAPLKLLTTILL